VNSLGDVYFLQGLFVEFPAGLAENEDIVLVQVIEELGDEVRVSAASLPQPFGQSGEIGASSEDCLYYLGGLLSERGGRTILVTKGFFSSSLSQSLKPFCVLDE